MRVEGVIEWRERNGKKRLFIGDFEIIGIVGSLEGKEVIMEIEVKK